MYVCVLLFLSVALAFACVCLYIGIPVPRVLGVDGIDSWISDSLKGPQGPLVPAGPARRCVYT